MEFVLHGTLMKEDFIAGMEHRGFSFKGTIENGTLMAYRNDIHTLDELQVISKALTNYRNLVVTLYNGVYYIDPNKWT